MTDAKRIVVLGASGFTGRLVVAALVARGARPCLAGRNAAKLEALAAGSGDLEWRTADATSAEDLRALLTPGDVLVTTVGPYSRYGATVVAAAVEAGAHYVDVTGEIGFARRVVETQGPKAEAAGVQLHTAAGYDYVPGHCLAAVVLDRAGEAAVRVDLGYFASRGARLELSQGTRASLVQAMLTPGVFWRGGRHVEGPGGTAVRRFDLGGRRCPALSISSTEHLFLPRLYPGLQDVNVYLGWFGVASLASPLVARSLSLLQRSDRVAELMRKRAASLQRSAGRGPGEASRSKLGSHVVGAAYDASGKELAAAELVGVNGYDFTARFVALLACAIARGDVRGRGALDPITALGRDGLVKACREAGLALSEPDRRLGAS